MPFVSVITNIASRNIPHNFETKLSALVSAVLKKPEDRISVMVNPDSRMCRGGSTDATVHVTLWSMAVFSKEKNPEYGKPIYSYINETLGVPYNRISIAFHEILPEQLPPRPED